MPKEFSTLLLVVCALSFFAPSILAEDDADAALSKAAEQSDEVAPAPADPADEQTTRPGHSHVSDAFNEGPRQAATLIGGAGKVHFPVTTTATEAQAFFDQGLGQLHGFWYFEAERSFRQAAKLDPKCAMAFWGMALANVNNETRAKGFVAEAAKRKDGISQREGMYIEAIEEYYRDEKRQKKDRDAGYVKSLERIVYNFPDDVEAKAFLALQIWSNSRSGIPISSHLTVDLLLDQVFAASPEHPAHHYRIHLWDGERPERAIRSAALLGPAAPAIAHMWHMPGHTYSELKRYADAAWQQEASARVDHAHMIRTGLLPDQIHNFAHNNEWLIRNLIHVGRVRDAVNLAKNMVELPQHPKYNTLHGRGSALLGRERLIEVLAAYELWDDLISLAYSDYLPATEVESEQIRRLRNLGIAFCGVGDVEQATGQLMLLQDRENKEKAAADKAMADAESKAKAENKNEKQVGEAKEAARRPMRRKLRILEEAIADINARILIAKGDFAGALPLLDKAKAPKSLIAHVQVQSGAKEEAEKTAREHAAARENEVLPLAHLVLTLWAVEKHEDARTAMQQLRQLAADADLHNPIFDRLRPVARAMDLPQDWRLPAVAASDLGVRPSLEELGPFRWRPSPAPQWGLFDANSQIVTFEEYRGTPVVLIFFLGHECLHCAEQLQAFAPMVDEYAAAGISLVGISTDNEPGLSESIAAYNKEGNFPFKLLSNDNLELFKKYRAFDDFEDQPLHGVFLIDGDGLVRWSDISFEPFMDTKFLLGEAKRLLGQSKHAGEPPATAGTASRNDLSSN